MKVEETKLEKFEIDTNGNLRKELDIVEQATRNLITKGSQEVIITKKEIQNIETKTIEIEGTGNFIGVKNSIINIPLEMIVFPFFTNQKQNRNVNFEYKFTDVGITMRSKLSSFDKKDKVYQPSLLEKKIYNYLIIMYEKSVENAEELEHIEFEVADFIERYLGNKMNSQYYVKVEQALKNLKNTQYEFLVDNHKKAGNLKFESPRFYLLDYSKLKIGKRVYYRVKLNSNIIQKINEKRYIKYDSKHLMEITDKDSVADRIYEFISMKRFSKESGVEKMEVLAGIIPLQTVKMNKRKLKDGRIVKYKASNMSFVRRRIKKAFDALCTLGYIKTYKEVEEAPKRYVIEYTFNTKKDNICHISSYLNQDNLLENNFDTREKADNVLMEQLSTHYSSLDKELERTKRNIYFSRKYNKRIYNKLKKMFDQEGEEFTLTLLRNIYSGLNTDIRKTLGAYIDSVAKNLKAQANNPVQQLNLMQSAQDTQTVKPVKVVEEAVIIPEAEVVVEKDLNTKAAPVVTNNEPEISESEKILVELYASFSDAKKAEIENKAKELYEEDLGMPLNPINETIFNKESVKKLYIRRVLKNIFGL